MASLRPMVPPVCVVGLMAPAAVSTAVVEAVEVGAPIVVVVAFEVAVAGPRLDLVRLLDQSRRTSPLHGTRLLLEKSPTRANTTRRPRRRPRVPQKSSSLLSRLPLQSQRRLGRACLPHQSPHPHPHPRYPKQPRSLPPLQLPKRLRKYLKPRPRTTFPMNQLSRPKNNPYPQLQTSLSKRHHLPLRIRPRRRQTRALEWLLPKLPCHRLGIN